MEKQKYIVYWIIHRPPGNLPPEESLEAFEKSVEHTERLKSKGIIKDVGYFSETEGFTIIEGGTGNKFDQGLFTTPTQMSHMDVRIREIIPFEKGNEMARKAIRARIRAHGN